MTRMAFDAQITFLPAADLDACTRFYETVLLLPPVLDQGACRIFRTFGDAYIGFCRSDAAPTLDDRQILTFVCEDVDG